MPSLCGRDAGPRRCIAIYCHSLFSGTRGGRDMHWVLNAIAAVLLQALLGLDHAGLSEDEPTLEPRIIETDLLIAGATESGWAAAIQAARGGVTSITIVHDGRWFGGQYTEQALACVDENKGVGKVGWGVDWHPMKRAFHRSGLFKELMDNIEAFNQQKYGSPMPGRPYHGPSTFRPAEAEAVFRAMIAPYIARGQIQVIWDHYPVAAKVDQGRLTAVQFAPTETDQFDLEVRARLTIDATDWGEVIQVSRTEFEVGPDPFHRYQEPSAPVDLSENPPNEMNPITWAMIVEQSDAETPIPRPLKFDDRNYPRATKFSLQSFGELDWDRSIPSLGAILHWPNADDVSRRQLSVYTVRRIVDGTASLEGKTSILLNYMNGQDYPLERLPLSVAEKLEATEANASKKNIVLMTRQQRQIVFDDAKQHALGVLYHMQNFVHERAEDKTHSLRNFRLSDEFGTLDRLPPKPYIRESLRLKAMYMMREQDGRNRDGETKKAARERLAPVMYPDAVFAWQFHYDFHRTGRTYLAAEGKAGPWIDFHKPNRHTSFVSDRSVFPLRSLVPISRDGLLGAQGNVGFSSIVSAAIRLHDQRVHIGQAAGAVAVVSLREGLNPRQIPFGRQWIEMVRYELCGHEETVPLLLWPFRDLACDHPHFIAINRVAALGILPDEPRAVDFEPDQPASSAWWEAFDCSSELKEGIFQTGVSRGELCARLWSRIEARHFSDFEIAIRNQEDADQDGILDRDDALPFTPNAPVKFQVEQPKLVPGTDGIPSTSILDNESAIFVDFTGKPGNVAPATAFERQPSCRWLVDLGAPLDFERGFGWTRDMAENHRRRNKFTGPRDTFRFTRDQDQWEMELDNGPYRVTVCIGDAAYPQAGQNVRVESVGFATDHYTASGAFTELSQSVLVADGTLTVSIGLQGAATNTTINWLAIEPMR